MAAPAISHYWSWGAVPEKFYGNVMAEFRDNGVNRLILTHFLLPRFAEEPEFRKSVLSLCSRFGMRFDGAHAPWGNAWDLNETDSDARKLMLRNQKRMIEAAGEAGAGSIVIHIGDSICKRADAPPVPVLRDLAVAALEELLPAAEKAGVTVAIENIIAPTDTIGELLAIFERTYGQIKRRDVLPMMALRSQDKRELLAQMEPAEEFVLVDGYNIIFAWDELKGIGRDSLDAARHVLMNLLCNYQGYRGCNLILVFDAYKVPQNLGTVEKYHNIFIVYTQEAETADSYIERVTYELRGRKKVRVATSDNLEQLIILGHGAVRVSAKSFHDEVMQTQQEIERVIVQNNQKSK